MKKKMEYSTSTGKASGQRLGLKPGPALEVGLGPRREPHATMDSNHGQRVRSNDNSEPNDEKRTRRREMKEKK